MNILVLNYEFPPIGGGASPVSKDLSAAYVKMGHTVKVVTMAFKDLPKEEKVEGIQVHRVKCMRTKAFVCHPWEQLSYLISSFGYLRRILRKECFDIVHAHFIIPTGVLAYWIKKKYHIPYVLTAHGSDVMGYNQKRFKLLHKLLLNPWKAIVQEADAIVSPSKYLEGLIKTQLPDTRCQMIPNGVDTKLFRPLCKKKQILVMCRLQETKNVQTVIAAMSMLKNASEWKLNIAGDGPYKAQLEHIVQEYGIQDRVNFLGWIGNKSLEHIKLVGEAAIYVSASRFENSPISVLEAMSAGCDMLLSDIVAHKAIMGTEKNLFPVDSAAILADKLMRKIDAYEKGVPDEYSLPNDWETVAKQYVAIFDGVM